MNWTPERPYAELPELPPVGEIETRAVLKAAIEARASVASLDASSTCRS